jgi:hypothetical protein
MNLICGNMRDAPLWRVVAHTHTLTLTKVEPVSGFVVLTLTYIYIYILAKEIYRTIEFINSQTDDVPRPLNIDISVLLLPTTTHHYLPIPPLVTSHIGLPFHTTLPWPVTSAIQLPASSGPPISSWWTQNTNTIESAKPNLPPNTVAIFYAYSTHGKASLHCIQTLVSKPWLATPCTHSREGTSLPQNSVWSEMCFSMELYDLAIITGIVLQWSCHLLCIFNVQNVWQDNLHF